MTQTDQAFIDAFKRSDAPRGKRPATPAAGPDQRRRTVLHGPHTRGAGRTPLTEAIAERMRRAAASSMVPEPEPFITLSRFAWPAIVEALARDHHADYLGFAPEPSTAEGVVLGFAGVHRGSGVTTTVLAIARCLAAQHGPVALVDADPARRGLAESLGVMGSPTLARVAAAGGATAQAIVHAADDRVSLVVAGAASAPLAGNTLAEPAGDLRRRCPITLIDLGAALDHGAAWRPGGAAEAVASAFEPTGIVLVRCGSDLSGSVSAAHAMVESTGAAVLGLIENASVEPVR